jgi:predicted transcriptional regulator
MRERADSLLGPTEWSVMTVIWEHGPATIPQVCYHLSAVRLVPYTTLMRVLAGLIDAGLLCAAGAPFPGYTYTPLLTKEEVITRALRERLADLQPGPQDRRRAVRALCA